ncbi:MAG: glycosyltransferase family 4 protein [Acidimicrobiia bacterium]
MSQPVVLPKPWSGADGVSVLAFSDYFSAAEGGGAERVAYQIYRRWAESGVAVTVAVADSDADVWGEEETGVRVWPLPAVNLTRVLHIQASVAVGTRRLIARLRDQGPPHVIHANSLQFQTSVIAARVATRLRIPLVLTAHIGGLGAMTSPLREMAQIHELTLGRWLLWRTHRIVAVSHPVASHLERYPQARGKVVVVPNGVDHAVFRPAPRSDWAVGPVKILYVGRLIRNKGPDQLLEALARLDRRALPAFTVTFVGDGPLRRRLEELAQRHHLSEVCRFVGTQPNVADRMREADILVRPSQTEGMPLAVLEAMASGLAIIASDVPGNWEALGGGQAGLRYPAGNVSLLAERLHSLISDPRLRHRLGRVAHDRSLLFTWDRTAHETLEVLRAAADIPRVRERA